MAMIRTTESGEPAPESPPVRRFRDPRYVARAATLAQLRDRIDAIDDQIVALLAQRAACVKDATRFKRDPHQVAAPARQAQVIARVCALAQSHHDDFDGLADIVEAAYRALVAGFVAREQALFDQTETIDDERS